MSRAPPPAAPREERAIEGLPRTGTDSSTANSTPRARVSIGAGRGRGAMRLRARPTVEMTSGWARRGGYLGPPVIRRHHSSSAGTAGLGDVQVSRKARMVHGVREHVGARVDAQELRGAECVLDVEDAPRRASSAVGKRSVRALETRRRAEVTTRVSVRPLVARGYVPEARNDARSGLTGLVPGRQRMSERPGMTVVATGAAVLDVGLRVGALPAAHRFRTPRCIRWAGAIAGAAVALDGR